MSSTGGGLKSAAVSSGVKISYDGNEITITVDDMEDMLDGDVSDTVRDMVEDLLGVK